MMIAIALLAGGSAVLASKEPHAIVSVGKKICIFLNDTGYRYQGCGKSRWAYVGYRSPEIITGVEHLQELRETLKHTQRELCIASGFLSSY